MLLGDSRSLVLALLLALVTDALIGDPPLLWRRFSHPVVLVGRAIDALEARLWRERGARLAGLAAVLLLLLPLGLLAVLLDPASRTLPAGWILLGLLFFPWFAWRSLVDHVGAVAEALGRGCDAARRAVGHLVGRDPDRLDPPAIARAAVESLAENFADGVVAPWFWALLFGLPGLVLYKAINTLDSMIGHRNARYRDFGLVAARLDDLANWIPARIAALLVALAAGRRIAGALACIRRDARRHRSPNAGWPEAAMAGALGLRLSGPRVYEGELAPEPWIGDGPAEIGRAEIEAALALGWRAFLLLLGVTLALLPFV